MAKKRKTNRQKRNRRRIKHGNTARRPVRRPPIRKRIQSAKSSRQRKRNNLRKEQKEIARRILDAIRDVREQSGNRLRQRDVKAKYAGKKNGRFVIKISISTRNLKTRKKFTVRMK